MALENSFKLIKKVLVTLIFVAISSAKAQNIQAHYDLGKDREYLTTTIEMFKTDKLGNTFFFVDFDYGRFDSNGVSLSYMEIARCFKLGKTPFSAHVEYNGGFSNVFTINDAWLTGVDYSWNKSDFSRGISLKALYKYIRDIEDNNSFQLTAVWYAHFFNKKVTFTGFIDYWKQAQFNREFVFLAEPQLWYNLNKTFSVGSEIEFSQGFVSEYFEVNPTIAAKWIF